MLPPPPPPNRVEQWDLNGSWVALANGSAAFTVIAETVNAQRPQSVRIVVSEADEAALPSHLNVFLTCLAEACSGFPSKLHSREESVAVSAGGEVSLTLQPAAVYTLTTLSSVELERPTAPPQRSLFAEPEESTVLFRSAFDGQRPQEPGYGLANFYEM